MALDKLTKVQSVGISSFIQVVGVVTATGGFVGDLTGNVTGNITGTTSNASGATGDFSIADKIVHTGDTNTALRFPAADTFTVETGGLERLRITSSGVKQVKNGNLNIYQTYIDFSGDQSSTPTTAAAIFRPADNTLAFSTGNNERLRITSAGLVGIGTINPTKALHLAQNSDIAIRMDSNNANANARTWEIVVGGNASNNAEMVFRTRQDDGTGGSECARIKRNGIIALPSGGGIDFSATGGPTNGTGTSELFDDYEEGTWTPDFVFGSSSTGISYITRNGIYVKVGKVVTLRGGFVLSNKGTATGQSFIGGFPYTVESLAYADATGIAGAASLSGTNGPPVVVAQNNQNKCLLWYNNSSGGRVIMTNGNFANNSEIYFTLVYTTT